MKSKKPAIATLALCVLIVSGSVGQAADPKTDLPGRGTFTITGTIGLPGVRLVGLPGSPLTDENGVYAAEVKSGWSGRVEPRKEGFVFQPPARVYELTISDLPNQDYVARVLVLTISGNAGLAGVMMQGLPGDPVTDADGSYSASVEYGWSGTATPKKGDRRFSPASKRYSPVKADFTDEDYTPATVVISDRIAFGAEPIQDVVVTADPEGYAATTDSQGRYRIEVPYGWTGTLSMSKPGFEFAPPGIPYSKVTTDIDKAQPSPLNREPFPPQLSDPRVYRSPVAPGDDVLVIPGTRVSVDEFAETSEDVRVMQQILRDMLSEPRMILGVLYDYGDFLGAEGRRSDAFYLQGYGVLFVMEVDFPLSPVASPDVDPNQEQEMPLDPVWQRARQRLYSPRDRSRYGSRAQPSQRDQMSFEQFKEDLINTLKHAANIRHIDPNENIILTVVGQSPENGQVVPAPSRGSFSGGAGGYSEGGSYSYGGGSFGPGGGSSYADSRSYVSGSGRAQSARRAGLSPAAPATTVLTIHASKADVDAFSAGHIDLEQFRQRVRVFAY